MELFLLGLSLQFSFLCLVCLLFGVIDEAGQVSLELRVKLPKRIFEFTIVISVIWSRFASSCFRSLGGFLAKSSFELVEPTLPVASSPFGFLGLSSKFVNA